MEVRHLHQMSTWDPSSSQRFKKQGDASFSSHGYRCVVKTTSTEILGELWRSTNGYMLASWTFKLGTPFDQVRKELEKAAYKLKQGL